jgi:hypothetical protein
VNQGLLGWPMPQAPTIPDVESILGADVTMGSANVYFDGPSIVLTTGRWLILTTITMNSGATSAANFTAKLWNGTTVAGSSQTQAPQTNTDSSITLSALVTVGSSETWKVSAANGTNTTGKIKAATTTNGAGNNATAIRAILLHG